MADERDPRVSERYRALPPEEPPRRLDEPIIAAARRAADKPNAPLVAPAGRHRWYYALGAVAVLVLAVAVTVQLDRQRPDPEALSAPEARKSAEEPARGVLRDSVRIEERAAPAAPAPSSSAPIAKPSEPPERWLERIVQMRNEGKHEEAEKELAEFRRQYPDYRIPEAALN